MTNRLVHKFNIDQDIAYGPIEEAEHPDLKELVGLWSQKRGNQEFPARNAFSPRDMKAFLRQVHIYDVVDGGRDFRARLVGTALVNGSADPTGKLLSEHPDRPLGARIAQTCRLVVDLRKPLHVAACHGVETGFRTILTVDSIWLPLGTNGVIEHIPAQSILELSQV